MVKRNLLSRRLNSSTSTKTMNTGFVVESTWVFTSIQQSNIHSKPLANKMWPSERALLNANERKRTEEWQRWTQSNLVFGLASKKLSEKRKTKEEARRMAKIIIDKASNRKRRKEKLTRTNQMISQKNYEATYMKTSFIGLASRNFTTTCY